MRKLVAVMAALGAVMALGSQRARADEYQEDPAAQQQAEAAQDAQVSAAEFQSQLGPYGQWIYDATYGEVFYPNVPAGWRPYLYGHWAWTSYGWMWVSEEPFGWAVYHYGRWWFNPALQRWGWVPGYEWAPAWVVWRFGEDAVGWAPLYVGYDTWVDSYPIYDEQWVYVPCDHFYGVPVYHYAYPASYGSHCYHETHAVHGYVGAHGYGPPPTYVASHSAVPVTTTPVYHTASPPAAGQHGSGAIAVYQPPHTSVYNPTRPAPTAIRGPGAARTPVIAPPSTHVPAAVASGAGSHGLGPRPGVGVTGPVGTHGNGNAPGHLVSPARPAVPNGPHGAVGRPSFPGGVASGAPSSPTGIGPVHRPVAPGNRPGSGYVPGRLPGGASAWNPTAPSSGPSPSAPNGNGWGKGTFGQRPPQGASAASSSSFLKPPPIPPRRPPGYIQEPHTPNTLASPQRSFAAPSYTAQRPTQAAFGSQASYSRPSYAAPTRYAQPSYVSQRPTYSAPMRYAQPSYVSQRPTYSAPMRYAQPSYAAPRTNSVQTYRSSFNTARGFSAPAYRAPSGGSFRSFSAPQRSFASFGGARMPAFSSSQVRRSNSGGSRAAPARRRR